MRRFHLVALATAALVASGCGDDDGNVPDAGQPVCGNGIVEGTEACDDGNPTAKDGCEATCTYSCDASANCNDGDACNGTETCNTTLHRCQAGTPLENGLACTYYAETLVADGDGGFRPGDPELRDDGICVNQACGRPCIDGSQCDDLDVCNGVESCDTVTYNVCVRGTALNCNDSLDCTADSCDAALGCQNILFDGDGDGYASPSLACDDARKGDCDDGDDTVYPGAAELCTDGKDNDCDGLADNDDPDKPTYFQDCDGDGFAEADAVSITQCAQPATTVQCIAWTTVTPVGVAYTDCDDSFNMVYPGATGPVSGYFDRPYCKGGGAQATGSEGSFSCASGTLNWDYDCNGVVNKYYNDPVSLYYQCNLYPWPSSSYWNYSGYGFRYGSSCGVTSEYGYSYVIAGSGDACTWYTSSNLYQYCR